MVVEPGSNGCRDRSELASPRPTALVGHSCNQQWDRCADGRGPTRSRERRDDLARLCPRCGGRRPHTRRAAGCVAGRWSGQLTAVTYQTANFVRAWARFEPATQRLGMRVGSSRCVHRMLLVLVSSLRLSAEFPRVRAARPRRWASGWAPESSAKGDRDERATPLCSRTDRCFCVARVVFSGRCYVRRLPVVCATVR